MATSCIHCVRNRRDAGGRVFHPLPITLRLTLLKCSTITASMALLSALLECAIEIALHHNTVARSSPRWSYIIWRIKVVARPEPAAETSWSSRPGFTSLISPCDRLPGLDLNLPLIPNDDPIFFYQTLYVFYNLKILYTSEGKHLQGDSRPLCFLFSSILAHNY